MRAPTAGFSNWICDANDAFIKGTDNSTGTNFETELQTLITGTFGFARLSDDSLSPADGGTRLTTSPLPTPRAPPGPFPTATSPRATGSRA